MTSAYCPCPPTPPTLCSASSTPPTRNARSRSAPTSTRAKRTGSSEGVSCRVQRSHVRERGGLGLDSADQVVQRYFGCHPVGGSDEAWVVAVCELGTASWAPLS